MANNSTNGNSLEEVLLQQVTVHQLTIDQAIKIVLSNAWQKYVEQSQQKKKRRCRVPTPELRPTKIRERLLKKGYTAHHAWPRSWAGTADPSNLRWLSHTERHEPFHQLWGHKYVLAELAGVASPLNRYLKNRDHCALPLQLIQLNRLVLDGLYPRVSGGIDFNPGPLGLERHFESRLVDLCPPQIEWQNSFPCEWNERQLGIFRQLFGAHQRTVRILNDLNHLFLPRSYALVPVYRGGIKETVSFLLNGAYLDRRVDPSLLGLSD